jgi:hypothetical protein
VEADAGFVEDVEDADEAGADLGGEADALGFAAAEGAAFAVEREVAEADVAQEAEPGADFVEDLGDDLLLLAGKVSSRRSGRRRRWRGRRRP